ncbi:MAG: immunoglobulin domain-containing protein [Verrucomicrobia bacterium]|nr:immunoglobulin domain-containing protein [Verrucomicrobiota bacterium]
MRKTGWRQVVLVVLALLGTGVATAATPPVFTLQPQSQTVAANTNVTFNALADGAPVPTYQWRKDGVNLPSQIGSSLNLPLVQAGDAGTYTVVATNSEGAVTSAAAVLGILGAPTITTQPQSQTVAVGASVSFTVVASGTPAPVYQWSKNGVAIAAPAGTAGTLTLASVQVADAGNYTVVATNSVGSITSNAAVLTVNNGAPIITAQPAGHALIAGRTAVFNVGATGTIGSVQWKKDGVAVAGGNALRLVLTDIQPADAGTYTVTLANTAGAVTSAPAALTVTASANPGRIANLSIRGTSGTGTKVLIMGFVTGGVGTSGSTPLLIRGVGPSIVPPPYGVTDALPDPLIQVVAQQTGLELARNDDWAGDAAVKAAATATGAFDLISDTSKDAALLSNLPGGVFSVIVSDKTGATGSVLAEMYDASVPQGYNAVTPRLMNISARAYVTATGTLIAGFVVTGDTATTVLIRAIGPNPAFAAAVGSEVLTDPQVTLYRSQGGVGSVVQTNDNWGGDPQLTSAGQRVGASVLTDTASKDAALLLTLDPGVYSAMAYSANATPGITLIEVYDVP